MIKNYFKIAWRSIKKNYFYSAVNIIGLSVGIAFTLLIAVYSWGELQVNHQLKNVDNQYILQSSWKDPNMGNELTTIAALPQALKETYPRLVKNYLRWDGVVSTISKGNNHFRENIQIVDSTMLNMYGFKLLYGDKNTALNDPFSVVITSNKALKYFNRLDVVGQTLTVENFSGSKHDFTISGVLAAVPKNSVTSINDNNKNEFFLPAGAARFMGRSMAGWNNVSLVTYLELNDGVKPRDLEGPIKQLIKSHAPLQISQNISIIPVPLTQYHLAANNGIISKMLYTLTGIAVFILLMAMINFVNLCISRSSSRMREMGIRKVLGSLKKQLIIQFLIESVLLVILSTIIALILYSIFRPYFSGVLDSNIISLFAFPPVFFPVIFIISILIGIVAGIYPAFILSSLKSVDSLKGKLRVSENIFVRKSLVAFQFSTAAVVFISALVVTQQVNLFFSKDLGYNKDYVVYAQVPRDWSKKGVQKMEAARNLFAQAPVVSNATLSWDIPNGAPANNASVFRQGSDSTQAITSQVVIPDNQYAATYGIPLIAGRFFSEEYSESDVKEAVINQSEAKALGWTDPNQAIGQPVRIQGNGQSYLITGVTADFHFGSMQQRIQPILFANVNDGTYYRYLSFKLKPGNIEKSLTALQQKWADILPGAPFEYYFMDDALTRLYKTELQLKKASYIATTLAIIIALLGVTGLISLSIQKRTKEISIRKILGSSVTAIINLFMKEFMVTLAIAGLIACPVAFILMQNWLNNYAYKVAITLNPFMISIIGLMLITAILIIIQTIKAALTNPVNSLRSE